MTEDRRKTPQPLTEEQLKWVAEQTERAAAKAAHQAALDAGRNERRHNRWAFLILLIGILVVFHLGNRASEGERQAIVDSGKAVAIDGCNRDYTEDVRIRDVFLTSQSVIQRRIDSGQSPNPKADKQAVAFYDEQLKTFKLPDCRKAESLLTSDPDRFVPEVEPFWQGSNNPELPRSVYEQPPGKPQG